MTDPAADVQGIPLPEGPANIIETDYEIGQDNLEARVGRSASTSTIPSS